MLAAAAAQHDLPACQIAELAREAIAGDALASAPWIGNLLAIATLIFTDDFRPASAMLEQALALTKLSGNNRAIGNVYSLLATLSYALGDLGVRDPGRTHLGPLRGDTGWEAVAYTASVPRGRSRAEVPLTRPRGCSSRRNPSHGRRAPTCSSSYLARAANFAAPGQLAEGVADLAEARRCLMRFSGYSGAAFAVVGESEPLALERLGRRDEARALIAEALPRARHCGAPRNLGATLRVAGLLDGHEQGVALAREAVEVLEGLGRNSSSRRLS